MGDKASDTNLVDFADVKRYAALLLDGSSNNCSNNCADFERGGILPFFGLPTLQNKCEAGRLLLSVLRKEDKTSDTNLVDSAFVKMYALLPLDCSSNNCSDLDLGGNLTFDCLPTQQNNCELVAAPCPYFKWTFAGYVLGLVATIVVMNVFNAAQPALLYIVPGVVGAAGLKALIDGNLKELYHFEDGGGDASAEASTDADEDTKKK